MPTSDEDPLIEDPPDWALDEASDDLDDVKDRHAITERAWTVVREREDERHDEYDDPDRGGEA